MGKSVAEEETKSKEAEKMKEEEGSVPEIEGMVRAMGVNEPLSEFKVDLNDESGLSTDVLISDLVNGGGAMNRWLGTCPAPVDYLGNPVDERFVLENSKEQCQKRAEEESRRYSKEETNRLQKLWEEEARGGLIGLKTDAKIMEAIFSSLGVGVGYKPYNSGSENKSIFAIQIQNNLAFGAFYLDEKDNGLIPIFSCFHDSHEVGILASAATDGCWRWDLIPSQWFANLYRDSMEKMNLPEEMRGRIKMDKLCIDSYTAQILGFHKTLLLDRVSGTIRCDPVTGRIEEFMVVMSYDNVERDKIHEGFGLISSNFKKFTENYSRELNEIRHAQMKEIEEFAGTDDPEEIIKMLKEGTLTARETSNISDDALPDDKGKGRE